jgi:hypothetical protein
MFEGCEMLSVEIHPYAVVEERGVKEPGCETVGRDAEGVLGDDIWWACWIETRGG